MPPENTMDGLEEVSESVETVTIGNGNKDDHDVKPLPPTDEDAEEANAESAPSDNKDEAEAAQAISNGEKDGPGIGMRPPPSTETPEQVTTTETYEAPFDRKELPEGDDAHLVQSKAAVTAGLPDVADNKSNDDGNDDDDDHLNIHAVASQETWSEITERDKQISSEESIQVMDHAHSVIEKRLEAADPSQLNISKFEATLARFTNSEIELGRRIAWGNFADIYVISKFDTSTLPNNFKGCTDEQHRITEQMKREYNETLFFNDTDGVGSPSSLTNNRRFSSSTRSIDSRSSFSSQASTASTSDACYLVVKVLRAQLLINTQLYATGAADIITEGTLLASLKHPHIVSIMGRSVPSVEGFASGKRDSVFLILERLEGNLNDKIKDWVQQRRSPASSQANNPNNTSIGGISESDHGTATTGGGGFGSRIRAKTQQRRDSNMQIFRERVEIMKQLADAMTYLASHNIIHRDLKLSNVGIDHEGNVKLIDFGLAKILPKHDQQKDFFNLTGNTGSIRYMAPEIGRGEQYNLKADVYSFAILLYEVLNLGKVWQGLSVDDIRQRAHHRKQRPSISIFWPATLKDLLRNTWSDVPAARLSMEHIYTILSKYSAELSSASS